MKLSDRLTEIDRDIAEFERAAGVAEQAGQNGPVMTALNGITRLRKERMDLEWSIAGERIKDPVKRAEYWRQGAVLNGSWQAAAMYEKQAKDAKEKQDAEAQAALDAEKRRQSPETMADEMADIVKSWPQKLRRRFLARISEEAARADVH